MGCFSNDHRQSVVSWIAMEWGKLDILINHVGINIRKASNDFTYFTSEAYRRVLGIDLF